MAQNQKSSGNKGAVITFIIIVLFFVFFAQLATCVSVHKKINPPYSVKPQLYDGTGFIVESDLSDSLDDFRSTTGVTPVIFVDYWDKWDTQYDTVADLADAIFEQSKLDESNVLLVLVCNKNEPDIFYEEMVIGTEARKLFTKDVESEFILDLVDRIYESGVNGLTKDLTDTFNEYAEIILKTSVDYGRVIKTVTSYVIIFSILIIIRSAIRKTSNNGKNSVKCPRCGKVYNNSKAAVCPHCSAVLAANKPKDVVHDDHVDHGSHHEGELMGDEDDRRHFFSSAKSYGKLSGKYRYEDDDNNTFRGNDYE